MQANKIWQMRKIYQISLRSLFIQLQPNLTMRISHYLLPILSAALLYSCGGEGNTGDMTSETELSTAAAGYPQDRDSIRLLYHQLMAARKDTLPLKQIREAGKLYPVDEAPGDTTFFVFREGLINAVQRKELFYLMDVIHPEIKVDFGGGSGVADFVSAWGLDSPEKAEKSGVWDILESILVNGGVFEDGGKMFLAPYVYAIWPGNRDAFEYVAIMGSMVRVRNAPNLQSQTLTMISYDLVKRLETTSIEETIGGETHPWEKIQLPDEEGKEGYVYGKYIASSIDYRAGFERQANGKWLMTFLVAGD